MEGSIADDDWEFTAPSNSLRTLVLLGRTGNGKSSTGNSILGRKEFVSKASYGGVTKTSELGTTVLLDGLMIKVIDTPGLFDSHVDVEFIGKELVKCFNMAKDGFHAIIIVLSVGKRFSKDEEAAISAMRTLFGSKVNDYVILVYTGGDELEENGQNLKEYWESCPDSLKEILSLCGQRCIVFDNKTNDQWKKTRQLDELLSLVNIVLTKNKGKPYIDESFRELKSGIGKLHECTKELQGITKLELSELEFNTRVTEMVQLRLKETTTLLEKKLAEEHSRLKEATEGLVQQLAQEKEARLRAEELADAAQTKSNVEIQKLQENLDSALKENEELRKRAKSGKCAVL